MTLSRFQEAMSAIGMRKKTVFIGRLTSGAFDANGEVSKEFNLTSGQQRNHDQRLLMHNCSWYNRRGEKLGWGDLTTVDFRVIAGQLSVGEMFIILSELDSYWMHPRTKMSKPGQKPLSMLSVPYLREHVKQIIVPNRIYRVAAAHQYWGQAEEQCLPYSRVSRQEASQLIDLGQTRDTASIY